jgi:hypothetical protein
MIEATRSHAAMNDAPLAEEPNRFGDVEPSFSGSWLKHHAPALAIPPRNVPMSVQRASWFPAATSSQADSPAVPVGRKET